MKHGQFLQDVRFAAAAIVFVTVFSGTAMSDDSELEKKKQRLVVELRALKSDDRTKSFGPQAARPPIGELGTKIRKLSAEARSTNKAAPRAIIPLPNIQFATPGMAQGTNGLGRLRKNQRELRDQRIGDVLLLQQQ